MDNPYQIRTGNWDDEPNVGALMAMAFATDPFVRWILPDPITYVESSMKHAGVTTGPAFDDGSVEMIGEAMGAALMKHSLEICDRDNLPVYLESTNVANLSIYKRHGFALLGEVQVGKSPMRYPMLRPAR